MNIRLGMGLAVLALVAGQAAAQSVTDRIKVAEGSSTLHFAETAIIASPLDNNYAIVAFNGATSSSIVAHATWTKDSFLSAATPVALTPPSVSCSSGTGSFDPMVAASASTGDLCVGAISGRRVFVQWYELGASSLNSAIPAIACLEVPNPCPDPPSTSALGVDKCLMGMGPWPAGGSYDTDEVLHVGFLGIGAPHSDSFYTAYATHSDDDTNVPVGQSWPTPGNAGFMNFVGAESTASVPSHGDGAYMLVVPSGDRAGRVVMAYAERALGFTECGTTTPGRQHVAVTYADALGSSNGPNGRRWEAKQVLGAYGINEDPIEVPIIHHQFPSGSIDPNDPDTMLVAFIGRGSTSEAEDDLFVALGTTSTLGALQFSSANTVRIPDSRLKLSGEETVTFAMPSIVIDTYGGVNLLIRVTLTDVDGPNVYARFARWSSIQSLMNLDSPSFITNLSGLFTQGPGNNDYQMMCLAGCKLYAAYASNEGGTWDIYVSVIALQEDCAAADVDGNSVVTLDDVSAFYSEYANATTRADRNRDVSVNGSDVTRFLDAYAAANP
jgi:hypothetical protein